jgi:hypothetical protein
MDELLTEAQVQQTLIEAEIKIKEAKIEKLIAEVCALKYQLKKENK